MTKIWITLAATAALLAGCKPIQPINSPFPDSIPEGLGGTPTESTPTAAPTEAVTSTPEPTATSEKEIVAQITEFTNTSQEKMSQGEVDKANLLTVACREYFSPKPEDIKTYSLKLTGLSIQGSEIIKLEAGENKLKFGYCNTEVYGNQETPVKALATTLIVYLGEGETEKPVFLPTFELKPEDLTPAMLKEVSSNLNDGETLEFVRLVPKVSPDGRILWPDANLGTAVSSDESIHLSKYGKELPKNDKMQDEFIPMVTAVRQGDGTLNYEITDPVEGRTTPDQVFVLEAGADGGFAGTNEVAEWSNSPSEVIEGKQFYNVFHIISEDGSESLLAARAGKTPEEALADKYSQLAEAKVNEEGKWVWEKLTPPALSWDAAKKYAMQDCDVTGVDAKSYIDHARNLAIDFGLDVPPDHDLPNNVREGKDVYIKQQGCLMSGFKLLDNSYVLLYRNMSGNLIALPVRGLH